VTGADAAGVPPLTPAQTQLVRAHLGFAESGALAHVRTLAYSAALDLDDLRGEAFLALVTVARRFQPERGLAFKTIAYRYIDGYLRHAIRRDLRQDGFGAGPTGGQRLTRHRQRVPIATPWDTTQGHGRARRAGVEALPAPVDAATDQRLEVGWMVRRALQHLTQPADRALFRRRMEGQSLACLAAAARTTVPAIAGRLRHIEQIIRAGERGQVVAPWRHQKPRSRGVTA